MSKNDAILGFEAKRLGLGIVFD